MHAFGRIRIETGGDYVCTGADGECRFQFEPYPLELPRWPPRLVGLDEAGVLSELGLGKPLDESLALPPLGPEWREAPREAPPLLGLPLCLVAGTLTLFGSCCPGSNIVTATPLFVLCGEKAIGSTVVGFEIRNRFGSDLGWGLAIDQAAEGAMKGTLIIGSDPISCSSKHSSAAGLDATELSSAAKSPETDEGKDTVANDCGVGSSNAFLLNESTASAWDFGGELLRPSRLLILSCQPPDTTGGSC